MAKEDKGYTAEDAADDALAAHKERMEAHHDHVRREMERMDNSRPTPTQEENDFAVLGGANVGGTGVRKSVRPGTHSGEMPGTADGSPHSPALRAPGGAAPGDVGGSGLKDADDGKVTRDVNTNARGAVAPTSTADAKKD